MSLYPGATRTDVNNKVVLDTTALGDSMAQAIEDAMAALFRDLGKGSLPEQGSDDRRILFTAIARGVLQYLSNHQDAIRASVTVTGSAGTYTVDHVNLNVTMGGHTAHA